MTAAQQSVQVYGRKKTATAVAHCRSGQGLIKVNGKPLDQIEPKPLQYKLQEPLLVVGKGKILAFCGINMVKQGFKPNHSNFETKIWFESDWCYNLQWPFTL